MRPMHRLLTAALALAGAAGPAATQTLDLGGVGHAFDAGGEGARAGFTRFMTVDAVSVEAVDGAARLVLEFALPPDARTGDQPHDARISFRPDGWRDYWVSPPRFPDGGVTIEHLDLSGPVPRIAGQFAVPLCHVASPLQRPDPARCLPARGRFDVILGRD